MHIKIGFALTDVSWKLHLILIADTPYFNEDCANKLMHPENASNPIFVIFSQCLHTYDELSVYKIATIWQHNK